MIIGIGNDLVDIRRIEELLEHSGERFIARCFTSEEQAKAKDRKAPHGSASVYAKRYAAKEACAKALGMGFGDGIYMSDIGVGSDENNRPVLQLTGGAQQRLEAIIPQGKIPQLHLSLSDEFPYAQAFVIIEAV